VVAQRGGEVDRPRPAQHPDGQVAQAGHHARAGAGAHRAAVLGEGDVTDMMHRLDGPVAAQQVGETGGAGLGEAQAGDRIDGHGPPSSGPQGTGLAGDLQDLGGVGEAEVADGDGCPVSMKLAQQRVADLRGARFAETASSWLSH
jgi:hypothetical protein